MRLVQFLIIMIATSSMPLHLNAAPTASDHLVQRRNSSTTAELPATYPFQFHSGFWINLHHFLYEQALLKRQGAGSSQPNSEPVTTAELSSDERRLWDAAVDIYRNTMIKRDLLNDLGMVTMNDQLSERENARDLNGSGLPPEVAKTLESVAAIYRTRYWPEHDRANRLWIATVTPLVQQFGRRLIDQLTTAYKAKWPKDLIRVDVVEYANWAGAYTSFDQQDRVHTTVGSFDADNQCFSALEILFHEASHSMVDPNNGMIAETIARISGDKHKPIPRGLWHAIIFYTAGEFTRRDLSEYGVSSYKPYAYRGLYERVWPKLQKPLEQYWQPYLEGRVGLDQAISDLVDNSG